MNQTQKAKRNFRASKKWRSFRHKINVKQNGLCYITHKKLYKSANLHHIDLNEEHYEDISNENNFVFLNKSMHDVVHALWRYYKTDKLVLKRLEEVLEMMLLTNNNEENKNGWAKRSKTPLINIKY